MIRELFVNILLADKTQNRITMRILLCLIMNALLLIHKTDAGDQPVEGLAVRGDPTDQVKEKADSAVQDVVPNTKKYVKPINNKSCTSSCISVPLMLLLVIILSMR